jgi:uncharacterized protein (TIGR02001 family)
MLWRASLLTASYFNSSSFFMGSYEMYAKHYLLLAGVLGSTIMVSTNALADDAAAPAAAPAAAATPTWTFPSSISLVSNYVWHGQTQTWGRPAMQAGIEADHASGFYAGVWGSNVSSHWLPNANLETDWSVGYRNTFATDFHYDIGGTYVYYPGSNFNHTSISIDPTTGRSYYDSAKLNTVELYGILGWKWFSVRAGVNPTKFYGWSTNNAGEGAFPGDPNAKVTGSTNGSGYVVASGSYDLPQGFNISGEVGHQMIANSQNLDWSWWKAGLTKNFDGGWAVNGSVSGTWGTDAFKSYPSFDAPYSTTNTWNDTKTVDKTRVFFSLTKNF